MEPTRQNARWACRRRLRSPTYTALTARVQSLLNIQISSHIPTSLPVGPATRPSAQVPFSYVKCEFDALTAKALFVFGGIAERARHWQLSFQNEAKFSVPVSGSFLHGAGWSEKTGLRARVSGSPALAAGIQVRLGGALNWLRVVVGDGRARPVEGNTRVFYEAGLYLQFSTLDSQEKQGLAFKFSGYLKFKRPNKINSTHCHCATPCPIRPGKLAFGWLPLASISGS